MRKLIGWSIIAHALSGCAVIGGSSDPANMAIGVYSSQTISAETLHQSVGPLDSFGRPLPFDPSCIDEQRAYEFTQTMPAIKLWTRLNAAWMTSVQSNFPSTRQYVGQNLNHCVRNPYRLPAADTETSSGTKN